MPSMETEFSDFWARYPRKVGKLAARKAYDKARRSSGATQEELLSGVDAYVQHKPDYQDFAHPSSWLNAGRWMDEWDETPVRREREFTAREIQEANDWRRAMNGCGHSPRCDTREECIARVIRRRRGTAA